MLDLAADTQQIERKLPNVFCGQAVARHLSGDRKERPGRRNCGTFLMDGHRLRGPSYQMCPNAF
jgi:hypothetical protein